MEEEVQERVVLARAVAWMTILSLVWWWVADGIKELKLRVMRFTSLR